MESVLSFNKDQRETFNLIVSDFSGPTMTAFVLELLESAIGQCGNVFEGDDAGDVAVCMAALEYHRMQTLGSVD